MESGGLAAHETAAEAHEGKNLNVLQLAFLDEL